MFSMGPGVCMCRTHDSKMSKMSACCVKRHKAVSLRGPNPPPRQKQFLELMQQRPLLRPPRGLAKVLEGE